jgi:hypothetical protein
MKNKLTEWIAGTLAWVIGLPIAAGFLLFFAIFKMLVGNTKYEKRI